MNPSDAKRYTQATRHLLDIIDHRLTNDINHLNTERSLIDGYPHTSDDTGRSSKNTITDPTSSNALQRIAIDRYTHALTSGIRALPQAANDLLETLDLIRGLRSTTATPPQAPAGRTRCSGVVDPTCTNWASEHRHPETGIAIDDICDECFMTKACRTCKHKPRDGRNSQCAACRKRDQRTGGAAA